MALGDKITSSGNSMFITDVDEIVINGFDKNGVTCSVVNNDIRIDFSNLYYVTRYSDITIQDSNTPYAQLVPSSASNAKTLIDALLASHYYNTIKKIVFSVTQSEADNEPVITVLYSDFPTVTFEAAYIGVGDYTITASENIFTNRVIGSNGFGNELFSDVWFLIKSVGSVNSLVLKTSALVAGAYVASNDRITTQIMTVEVLS